MLLRTAISIGLLVGILGGVGCGDDGPGEPSIPELWSRDPVDPPEADFFDQRPWLGNLSSWTSPGCGAGQPNDAAHMGDLAVGNGHTFALTGYACPLNTLHTMIGPNYQKDEAFFDDVWSELQVNGLPVQVRAGHLFRVRRTNILLTAERGDELDLYTVSFSPLAPGVADPVERSIVRAFVVRNRGSQSSGPVSLVTQAGKGQVNSRRRKLICLTPAQVADSTRIELGSLAPGQEHLVVLAYLLTIDGQGEEATEAALRGRGVDRLLEDTRDAWSGWLDQAARLRSPDPKVDDLYEGLLVTVRSEQDHRGGVSPMSEYSRIWTRDCAGPVRLFARAGLHADAWAILEYYHAAVVASGDIANSYALDHDLANLPPEPDWATRGPRQGKAAAEAPSYIPIMARWVSQASGDHSYAAERFAFLQYALAGQIFDQDGLQTFSGDETFRAAMSIANGRHLEHDYPGCCLSANSAFLFVVAAESLAAEAEFLGLESEATTWRDRAAFSRASAERTFWHSDGYYQSFVDRTQPHVAQLPYEDVSAKVLWAGFLAPGDERALTNVASVVERLGRDDGLWVSAVHESYAGLLGALLGRDVADGVYTGMNPGYGLDNLARVDHPSAERAFNALALAASSSGNFGEYLVHDDYSALQILYEPSGVQGDYTARYRPWEGAIVGDALMFYLTGFEPDADLRAARLAPRLVNHWPSMTWQGLQVGATRFGLVAEQRGSSRRVVIGPTDGGVLSIELALPLGACDLKAVRIDGQSLPGHEFEVWSPFGETRVVLPERPIGPVTTYEVEVVCEEST